MTMAVMALIVPNRVAGQKATHVPGNPIIAASYKDMSVVVKQCPGIDDRAGIDCDFAHAVDKIGSILVVINDLAFFDPPHDDMVQGAGGIQSGLARQIFSSVLDLKTNQR